MLLRPDAFFFGGEETTSAGRRTHEVRVETRFAVLADDPRAQHEALQRQLAERGTIDGVVFHLHGNLDQLLGQMKLLQVNATDLDGTQTGIGDTSLYDSAVAGIHDLRSTGVETLGVTGRHAGQIHQLRSAHGDALIPHYIGEQGAIIIREGREEGYLGTEAIMSGLALLRAKLDVWFAEIGARHRLRFIPTSGGGHRFQFSRDAHTADTDHKITDKSHHGDLAGEMAARIASEQDLFREWKLGTSSIGTFELSHAGMQKDKAVRRWVREHGIALDHTLWMGDSNNDKTMFDDEGPMLKTVVVNDHTRSDLVAKAHFATIGRGNAAPMSHLVAEQRRRGS